MYVHTYIAELVCLCFLMFEIKHERSLNRRRCVIRFADGLNLSVCVWKVERGAVWRRPSMAVLCCEVERGEGEGEGDGGDEVAMSIMPSLAYKHSKSLKDWRKK